jgi:hypothetical protein
MELVTYRKRMKITRKDRKKNESTLKTVLYSFVFELYNCCFYSQNSILNQQVERTLKEHKQKPINQSIYHINNITTQKKNNFPIIVLSC